MGRHCGIRRKQPLSELLGPTHIAGDEALSGRSVDERLEITAPFGRAAKPAAARRPKIAQPQRQLADARGDERLEPFAPAAREHRRGPCARYRDEHRIAVDDRRHDDPGRFAVIDHIDGNRARLTQGGDPAVRGAASGGDDREAYAVEILGNEFAPHGGESACRGPVLELGNEARGDDRDGRTRSRQQRRLAQCHLTAADDEDLLRAQIEEERKVLQAATVEWDGSNCGKYRDTSLRRNGTSG